jgi:ArsR family transcriptional regulator
MHLLLGGELCVCDLVAALQVPQPTASRHLAYLRRSGLVLCRREGQWCHYRIAPAKSKFHAQLLACLQACCGDVANADRDLKRLATAKRGCCG